MSAGGRRSIINLQSSNRGRVGSSQESIGSGSAARLGGSRRPWPLGPAARQDVAMRPIMASGLGRLAPDRASRTCCENLAQFAGYAGGNG